MEPLAFLLIHAIPVVLSLAVCAWQWSRPSPSAVLCSVGIALAWAFGLFSLEGLWPWQILPIGRAIHWMPIALLAPLAVSWMLDDTTFKKRWTYLALLSMGTFFAWLMLRPYLFKVNADWTSAQHLALALALMLGSWLHHAGLAGMARALPVPSLFIAVGLLIVGAMLYGFQGASSLKVAQLLGITGGLVGALTLLAFWIRPEPCGASMGWLFSSMIILPLLYGVYAADEPLLWPLIPLLTATVAGVPYAFRASVPKARFTQILLMLGTIIALSATAVALAFMSGNDDEETDDLYDAYGWLESEASADCLLTLEEERRPASELSSWL